MDRRRSYSKRSCELPLKGEEKEKCAMDIEDVIPILLSSMRMLRHRKPQPAVTSPEELMAVWLQPVYLVKS